jgi:hypothetical protein
VLNAKEKSMKKIISPINGWLWLTFPIAILLAIAAGGGVFSSGLYRDTPYFVAQAVGQDIISLFVVLPTLIISAFFASRGAPTGRLIWLGVLVYLVYTYAVAAFDVRFNPFFLVYVALLGCSLYTLIGGLVTTDVVSIKAAFTDKTPLKAVSIYLAVLAVLFYFMWLSEIIPSLAAGNIPQSVQQNGTPTNAVQVLDMAWILPAFLITACILWRKQALGYTLAGGLLTYCVLLILAVLGMVAFMVQKGQPVVIPQVVIFGVILALNFGMLVWYMSHQSSTRNIG